MTSLGFYVLGWGALGLFWTMPCDCSIIGEPATIQNSPVPFYYMEFLGISPFPESRLVHLHVFLSIKCSHPDSQCTVDCRLYPPLADTLPNPAEGVEQTPIWRKLRAANWTLKIWNSTSESGVNTLYYPSTPLSVSLHRITSFIQRFLGLKKKKKNGRSYFWWVEVLNSFRPAISSHHLQ